MSRLLIVVSSLAAASLMAACGSLGCGSLGLDDASRGPYFTGTGNYGQGGSGNSQGGMGSGGQGATGAGGFNYSDHCGGGCVPGTDEAALECAVDSGGAGGAPSAGGMGGMGGGGGDLGGQGGGEPVADCKLVVSDRAMTHGECGETAYGNPSVCLSAADCGPGQGCVLEGPSGTCRPYCCGDVEACPTAQYCALRPIVQEDLAAENRLEIPVCVDVDDCELLNDATCDAGMTCTIVRNDGTVSCIPPGAGVADDVCPCDEGHYCDTTINSCRKICRTDDETTCPEGYICQGGTGNHPMDFGGCVEEL
jgi:hypothetical protein